MLCTIIEQLFGIYVIKCRRIAIIDFDIHHGNGTEMVVRNLSPTKINCAISKLNSSFAINSFKPW